ncbi:hypothetical protein BC828DRAFT_199997 [Blastocladiella britannica]|nr:hypothetical protein BC828DRAFT_199997 [Blastocladiella britannica]
MCPRTRMAKGVAATAATCGTLRQRLHQSMVTQLRIGPHGATQVQEWCAHVRRGRLGVRGGRGQADGGVLDQYCSRDQSPPVQPRHGWLIGAHPLPGVVPRVLGATVSHSRRRFRSLVRRGRPVDKFFSRVKTTLRTDEPIALAFGDQEGSAVVGPRSAPSSAVRSRWCSCWWLWTSSGRRAFARRARGVRCTPIMHVTIRPRTVLESTAVKCTYLLHCPSVHCHGQWGNRDALATSLPRPDDRTRPIQHQAYARP